MTNHLAKNIRFLRKLNNWSQEELAGRLQIKRSSIAAYESKNVRPRLDLILAMSKLFGVGISDLIEKDLTGSGEQAEMTNSQAEEANLFQSNGNQLFIFEEDEAFQVFIEKTIGIRKMLEGFKAFYRLRLENIGELQGDARQLAGDIENFLLLMDHLLTCNEVVIRAVSKEKTDA